MNTLSSDETWERLGSITHLLHHAANRAWADAAPDSPRQSLGLGVYLVQAKASALLPDDYQLPDAEEDLADRTTLQLLAAAEELSRPLPAHRPDLVTSAQLAVELCDLIREARDLGC